MDRVPVLREGSCLPVEGVTSKIGTAEPFSVCALALAGATWLYPAPEVRHRADR